MSAKSYLLFLTCEKLPYILYLFIFWNPIVRMNDETPLKRPFKRMQRRFNVIPFD